MDMKISHRDIIEEFILVNDNNSLLNKNDWMAFKDKTNELDLILEQYGSYMKSRNEEEIIKSSDKIESILDFIFKALNKFKEIYYLDNVDFYIPKSNSIILSIPFFNDFILNTITKKLLNSILEYEISNITIVTISNAQVLFLEDLEVQILPSYEWALS